MGSPMPCVISAQLDTYLDQLDREEEIEQAISTEAECLVEGEYSPYLAENLEETISEFTKMDFHLIGQMLKDSKYQAAAQYLERATVEYWTTEARRRAELNCDGEFDQK